MQQELPEVFLAEALPKENTINFKNLIKFSWQQETWLQKEWCYMDFSRSKIQKLLVWILVGSGLTKSNFTFSKRFSVSDLSDNFLILSRILFLAPLVTAWKVKGIIMKSFPSSTNEKNHKAVLFTIYTSVWAL